MRIPDGLIPGQHVKAWKTDIRIKSHPERVIIAAVGIDLGGSLPIDPHGDDLSALAIKRKAPPAEANGGHSASGDLLHLLTNRMPEVR